MYAKNVFITKTTNKLMRELDIKKYSESNHYSYLGEEYASTYRTKHVLDIENAYLQKSRTIKSYDLYDLELKAQMQFFDWAEREQELRKKENITLTVEQSNILCEERRKEIDQILIYALNVNNVIDIDSLKKNDSFYTQRPKNEVKKETEEWENRHKPQILKMPIEPNKDSYAPKYSFLEKIIPSKRRCINDKFSKLYQEDYESWIQKCLKTEEHNEEERNKYKKLKDEVCRGYTKMHEEDVEKWKNRKEKFYKRQEEHNSVIDTFKLKYGEADTDAIEEYCELVLNKSKYPGFINKEYVIKYNPGGKLLIVEYQLPLLESFPTEKEYKYISSKDEYKITHISQTELNKIYDKALYDITLRTLYEIFESDRANAIEIVSFNGWINNIDKATGNESNKCIISIQVNKREISDINFKNVDSKMCFKKLKGISSSKLYEITPIQPILQISKEDKRFVDSYSVTGDIDTSTNLAAMDWEDFEHLIREIFEKEFSQNGGEVKVTQASRDGGVDAIAFDPDPIRGGKIVIQAKRYTNTVGVSAVRDLYGTVMNEGATKGLLVTTSDFGPDAYSFAKDKPLSLLNGANLLYLLENHGIHARIDIKEAKGIKV